MRDLLRDALVLWEVPARVVVTADGVALEGMAIGVAPARGAEHPVRWWVERGGQRRPCTSVLGLLRTLRNAVGAGEGEAARLRVAP